MEEKESDYKYIKFSLQIMFCLRAHSHWCSVVHECKSYHKLRNLRRNPHSERGINGIGSIPDWDYDFCLSDLYVYRSLS